MSIARRVIAHMIDALDGFDVASYDTKKAKTVFNEWSDPMGRQRGKFVTYTEMDGYYSTSYTGWEADPLGNIVRSHLGSGLHAPIFDVDHPVEHLGMVNGITHLRVDRVDRRAVRRGLKALARSTNLDHAIAREQREALTSAIRNEGRYGSADIYLTRPVRVFQSRTVGHSHLYIDAPMSMAASKRLAKALGVVDRKYIKASQHYWSARIPLLARLGLPENLSAKDKATYEHLASVCVFKDEQVENLARNQGWTMADLTLWSERFKPGHLQNCLDAGFSLRELTALTKQGNPPDEGQVGLMTALLR